MSLVAELRYQYLVDSQQLQGMLTGANKQQKVATMCRCAQTHTPLLDETTRQQALRFIKQQAETAADLFAALPVGARSTWLANFVENLVYFVTDRVSVASFLLTCMK